MSVFRRSVEFNAATREGLRDKSAYDAFLSLLSYLESADNAENLLRFLRYLLYRFLQLREQATIPLARLQRMSLEQYDALITGLLNTPSGGRFPVLLVVATFTAIKRYFGTDWQIEFQGINVADAASGAGGDITIVSGDRVVMAAEVTERPVEQNRVVTTFNSKIAPGSIEDYLFFVRPGAPTPEARQRARQYFAQGHEVNFLVVKDWIVMVLATIGARGRDIFNKAVLELLEASDVPAALRVSWNQQVENAIAS